MDMGKTKFSCPKCGELVPWYKSVYMTNFTRIRCDRCGIRMRPSRKALSLIGGIGGGIGSLLSLPVIISCDSWLSAGLALTALLLALLLAASYLTFRFTHFIEVPEDA